MITMGEPDSTEGEGYTRPERLLALAGIAAGALLMLIGLDVATGGRLAGRRGGCGCQDGDGHEPDGS